MGMSISSCDECRESRIVITCGLEGNPHWDPSNATSYTRSAVERRGTRTLMMITYLI